MTTCSILHTIQDFKFDNFPHSPNFPDLAPNLNKSMDDMDRT